MSINNKIKVGECGLVKKGETSKMDGLILSLALYVADLTTENFDRLMIGLGDETEACIIHTICRMKPSDAVKVLKMMFTVGEMKEEADMFIILDICSRYDEGIYDLFMDIFKDDKIIDWKYPEIMFDGPDMEEEDD